MKWELTFSCEIEVWRYAFILWRQNFPLVPVTLLAKGRIILLLKWDWGRIHFSYQSSSQFSTHEIHQSKSLQIFGTSIFMKTKEGNPTVRLTYLIFWIGCVHYTSSFLACVNDNTNYSSWKINKQKTRGVK